MSKFTAFFKKNVKEAKDVKITLDRFSEPFIIKPLTDEQNEQIRKESMKTNKKTGTTDFDNNKYLKDMVVESVIFPDLKDAELQKDWGVIGANNLIKKMLLAGEFMSLASAVQDAAGFDTDNIAKEIDEVKND